MQKFNANHTASWEMDGHSKYVREKKKQILPERVVPGLVGGLLRHSVAQHTAVHAKLLYMGVKRGESATQKLL